MTKTIFIAIGTSGLMIALYRSPVIPVYFAKAAGLPESESFFSTYPLVAAALIILSAWAYLLFFRPVFYRMSLAQWFVITLLVTVSLTAIGTGITQFIATQLRGI